MRKKFKLYNKSEPEGKFVDFGAITLLIYAATLFIMAFNEFLFWQLPKLIFNNFHLNWKDNMNDRTDREFLEYLHNKMLWKIVSRKEFNNWINKTDGGLTWREALQDFTNSSIFHLRVKNVINSVVGESQK